MEYSLLFFGCVHSPLVMNELLLILQQNGCEAISYADDIVLVISGRFVNTIRDMMQLALRSVCMLASDRGLSVNPVKTEVLFFKRRYKPPTFRPLKLNGTELKLKKKAYFLGLILDRKLS